MPRQAIFGGWSLELPSDFDRQETDDGFVIFRRDGHTVWATVYEVDAETTEGGLREILDGFFDCSPEQPFEELAPHVVGCTIDAQENSTDGITGLSALAAIPGRVARIDFEFEGREERSVAIEIWHSCQIELGTTIADAALNKLWLAIQSGGSTQQAVETLRDQGRGGEVLLLLRTCRPGTDRPRKRLLGP